MHMLDNVKNIITILSLWIFFPLIVMFFLSGVSVIFRSRKLEIILRAILRVFLGMGTYRNDCDMKISYQFKGLDCGCVALKNALLFLDGKLREFNLPSPSSMLDLHKTALEHGFQSKGIADMPMDRLKEIVLEKNTKCIALLNAFYPFVGFWVRPTRIMLKLLIDKQRALHWVVVYEICKDKIVFIDPYFGYIKIPIRFFDDAWSKTVLVVNENQ